MSYGGAFRAFMIQLPNFQNKEKQIFNTKSQTQDISLEFSSWFEETNFVISM
jgi:hypothetical protein